MNKIYDYFSKNSEYFVNSVWFSFLFSHLPFEGKETGFLRKIFFLNKIVTLNKK